MGARLRKFALTAHVACSVGSLGAIACFLALAVAGLTSQDAPMVRANYLAMELTAWFVIVPMVLAALLTGLVQALGTTWGLFRHYWVLLKLLVTVLVAVVLLLQLELIGFLAEVVADDAARCGPPRVEGITGAPRRRRSAGSARAAGALPLQAPGHDPVWLA